MNKHLIEKLSEQAAKDTIDPAINVNYQWDWETRFAELILAECIKVCENVGESADFMAKSEFVTASGRMLHEGMWGGATNCANEIKQHFGVE